MYAVVDVSATGFHAARNRIVEMAIVGMDQAGTVEWARTTLINPQRDVGPTSVHGIRARDVADETPALPQWPSLPIHEVDGWRTLVHC